MFFLAPTWAFQEEVGGWFSTSHEQGRAKFKFLFCQIQGMKDETLVLQVGLPLCSPLPKSPKAAAHTESSVVAQCCSAIVTANHEGTKLVAEPLVGVNQGKL